ncbi:nucleotidyltransferase domain-containing protein [Candidatus Eisenbacteria bacterium]|uniref:Nucleotidyltransferase domain-containing protein n=1 Tax=Eiseniibacteriota bacterium TaxID=2212470 RepID=A0ABV6YIG4_UNCEI
MTNPTIARQDIIDMLATALRQKSYIQAAWLGGSDASGRTDELSDIDMQIIVEDERVEDAFAYVHRTLEALSPIELRYRFPDPTWHGHSQELLLLRDADPNHFLDFVVMKRSTPDRLLEKERHGEPMVLFDPEGLLKPPPLDWETHRAKMEARLDTLRAQFPLLQPLVSRGIARGHAAESAYGYQVLTIKPLVELLRLRYCPERFDYGLRYLDRDLPDEWREEIERLAYPTSPAALLGMHSQAVGHFTKQLVAYDNGEWTLPTRS